MNNISTRILIYEKNGSNLKPIKIYTDKDGKKWVEARNKTKFVIEVKNNSYNKVLSVVSVDGLSVLDGKRATLENPNGYVIDPHSNIKINGWRTSLSDVREFVFTSNKKETYSHKLGADERNIGVIGFAFYKQKINYSWSYSPSTFFNNPYKIDYTTCGATYNSNTAYTVNSSCAENTKSYPKVELNSMSMGTKQGTKIEDKAITVDIDFEDTPFIIDAIYYDSRENLIKKGIIKKEVQGLPQPFAQTGFCPDL
jgi:hypothetical protein